MLSITTEFPLGQSIISYEKLPKDYASSLHTHLTTLKYYSGEYDDREICRQQRWYHTEHKYFNPTWPFYERWQSLEYDELLLTLQEEINKTVVAKLKTDWTANSLLINRYINGGSIIPKHRDSEEIFGDNPTIAVLSIGATRTIRFTPIDPNTKSLKAVTKDLIDIELESNSLLIMAGTTQKYYCHEILKEEKSTLPRYSLTFRDHKM